VSGGEFIAHACLQTQAVTSQLTFFLIANQKLFNVWLAGG
jgi:hypothetical protein